jgi:signal transduction histidine kinase
VPRSSRSAQIVSYSGSTAWWETCSTPPRIRAGKLELRVETCILLAAVRESVGMQHAVWEDRTLALPHRGALTLQADPNRTGQVIANFLTNALKYSPPDQPVAVRVCRHGATAGLEVRDDGRGLSLEQQAHLCERFHRMEGIEQQSGSGFGLGLGLISVRRSSSAMAVLWGWRAWWDRDRRFGSPCP